MSNIQRMQTDQARRELESSRRLGQRWIDTTVAIAERRRRSSVRLRLPRSLRAALRHPRRQNQLFGPSEACSIPQREFPETGQFRFKFSGRAGQERADPVCG